jgi:hypothetical protein
MLNYSDAIRPEPVEGSTVVRQVPLVLSEIERASRTG